MCGNRAGWRFWALLLALLALELATAACETDLATLTEGLTSTPPASAETSTPQSSTIYDIGELVSIGDLALVVLGWDSPPGNEFIRPAEGQKFVAVDTLLANQGLTPTSVSSLMQMSLQDGAGQKYDLDLLASIAIGSIGHEGAISPGERVRSKVGFQVPKEAGALTFIFDATALGAGQVLVRLGSEPALAAPPAPFAEMRTETKFAIGEAIEIGKLTLTVSEVTSPPESGFLKPGTGRKFLVVSLTVKNRGSETLLLSSLLQMYLQDSAGQKYYADLMASAASGGSIPDGLLAPGGEVRGKVGFLVPAEAQGLLFVFDGSLYGYGKVFVALPSP